MKSKSNFKTTDFRRINIFISVRIALSAALILFHGSLLLKPFEHHAYMLARMDVISQGRLVDIFAIGLPWLGYLLGGFLLVGLHIKFCLGAMILFSAGESLFFARAISINPPETVAVTVFHDFPLTVSFLLGVNLLILLISIILIFQRHKASEHSLDRYYRRF